MLWRLTSPWFVNVASCVNKILFKNISSSCSFRRPHSQNCKRLWKSFSFNCWCEIWNGWNWLTWSIRKVLRRLMPLSRSNCLVLTCGSRITAVKMFIVFPSSIALFGFRWSRILLSTFPVSWIFFIIFAKTESEGQLQSGRSHFHHTHLPQFYDIHHKSEPFPLSLEYY